MLGEDATRCRAMVAGCNCLGCDRTDIQFATREVSRWFSAPFQGDQDNIVGIGKYLNGEFRRVIQLFPFGRDGGVIRA